MESVCACSDALVGLWQSAPSPLNYFKTAYSSYAIVVAVSVSTDDHFILNFCFLVFLNIVCLVIFHLALLFVILFGHDGILLLKRHLTLSLHHRAKLWAGILGITMLFNFILLLWIHILEVRRRMTASTNITHLVMPALQIWWRGSVIRHVVAPLHHRRLHHVGLLLLLGAELRMEEATVEVLVTWMHEVSQHLLVACATITRLDRVGDRWRGRYVLVVTEDRRWCARWIRDVRRRMHQVEGLLLEECRMITYLWALMLLVLKETAELRYLLLLVK